MPTVAVGAGADVAVGGGVVGGSAGGGAGGVSATGAGGGAAGAGSVARGAAADGMAVAVAGTAVAVSGRRVLEGRGVGVGSMAVAGCVCAAEGGESRPRMMIRPPVTAPAIMRVTPPIAT